MADSGKIDGAIRIIAFMAIGFGIAMVLVSIFNLAGCTPGHADGYAAEEFIGPANSRCFVVLNGQTPVGGNCVP